MTSETKVPGILRLAALKIKCRLPFQALLPAFQGFLLKKLNHPD
ncbi:hypothetical protein [Methanosarcina sp. 1.H.A.2.2]|nr:hypothetical protein [Methanosarcina sp. 1.H.A.2.2]